MKRYWLSWRDYGEDPRPTTFPPNDQVLGWWESGVGDDYVTICAVVLAGSEDECEEVIRKDWPEFDGEWRFGPDEKPDDYRPGDRFPLSDWMVDRFRKEPPK